jgi:uncharacterized membrane protein
VLPILAEELQTLSVLRRDRLEKVISSASRLTVRVRVDVVTGAFVVVKLLPLCVLRCIWVVGPC